MKHDLLNELRKVESQLPDDQWDKHHWNGVKAGIIRSINIICGTEYNYNLSAKEIERTV